MKTKTQFIRAGLISGLVIPVVTSLAQPVSLSVQSTNGQVKVSWPPDLNLVQPQKSTNLALGAWEDYGAATTASNLTEAPGVEAAFYRLRLLAPTITTPPQGQTNSIGSNITFTVFATGTAPFTYQWRKNTTNLVGQTGTSLALNGVATNDSGSYTVVVTNRAGSVTSIVATLLITNPPPQPAGIYMGQFTGQVDAGGFAVMVRSNALAYVVGYNTANDDGVSKEAFTVAANGTFSFLTDQADWVAGTVTASTISGTFTNSTFNPGTYSGTRKADTGIHAADAGYYVGNFTNLVYNFVGSARAVLAADGTIFFYSSDSTGDGGGYCTINSGNTVSGTTVPDGFTVGGTLNTTTKVISGSYKSGPTTVGTYSITRTLTP
jgi:hypothetical protein